MDFLELVTNRQSDRGFDTTRKVEKEKIEKILESARLAPSACNGQPWHFIVVNDENVRKEVAACCTTKALFLNHFTQQAPLHIVIVEEKTNISSGLGGWVKNKEFPQIDIGIVASHIVLAAESLGLGSCMIGWFNEEKMKKVLSVPSEKRIMLDIIIGYSTKPKREKKRKNLNEICSYNKY
ncbi:MAG: nitroreductase family protein [Bacteroidales bacterium]|nr:nitroreductase family protein [Bacteroidales bacterium]